MAFKLKIEGMHDVQEKLRELAEKATEAAGQGLYAGGLEVMNQSKRNAPVITGNLRNSGYVEKPRITKSGAYLNLGHRAPYAAAVHEGPHSKKRKYLSRAIEEKTPEVLDRVVKAVNEALDG